MTKSHMPTETSLQDISTLVSSIKKYLLRVVPAVLDCESDDFTSALSNIENTDLLTIFAGDSTSPSLIIHKYTLNESESTDISSQPVFFLFELHLKKHDADILAKQNVVSLAFIKTTASLNTVKPLGVQLQMVQLNDSSPYQTLLQYVRHCFLPISRTIDTSQPNTHTTPTPAVDSARLLTKKLSELEQELLRASTTTAIPLVSFDPPKAIVEYLSSLAEGVSSSVDDIPHNGDTDLLNRAQQTVNTWRREVREVCSVDHDVLTADTQHEIQFWVSKDKAVRHILTQLDSGVVRLTFDLLNKHKRFMATTNFKQDSGLNTHDLVASCAEFLRDLPIKPLLGEVALTELPVVVEGIFSHLRMLRRVDYPLLRVVDLLTVVGNDVARKVVKVWVQSEACATPFATFSSILAQTTKVFNTWELQNDLFSRELLDISRKRGGSEYPAVNARLNANTANASQSKELLHVLQRRVDKLAALRKGHNALVTTIRQTLVKDTASLAFITEKLSAAYRIIQDTAAMLEVDPHKDDYVNTHTAYVTAVDRVEVDLEVKLQQLFTRANKDTNALFRICAQFQELSQRPRIANALRSRQDELLSLVRQDIEQLQLNLRSMRFDSNAIAVCSSRDIPPTATHIIYATKQSKQLDLYMQRLVSVLGKRWAQHPEGLKISKVVEQLQYRLNVASIVEGWVKNTLKLKPSVEAGLVFGMVPVSQVSGSRVDPTANSVPGSTSLSINYDRRLVNIFKEGRVISNLVGRLPFDASEIVRIAKQRYTHATRLFDMLSTYNRANDLIVASQDLQLLAAHSQRKMQKLLEECAGLRWDSGRIHAVVITLSTQASEYEQQSLELQVQLNAIDKHVNALYKERPSVEFWRGTLLALQHVVDSVDKTLPAGYANMVSWVDSLNVRLEKTFANLLSNVVGVWSAALPYQFVTDHYRTAYVEDLVLNTNSTTGHKLTLADVTFTQPLHHAINVVGASFVLEPPIPFAALQIRSELNKWLDICADLPKLRCFAHASLLPAKLVQATFASCYQHIPINVLADCAEAVSALTKRAESSSQQWLAYQALWDLDLDKVTQDMGINMQAWQQLLVDIRKSSWNIESGSVLRFGPISIDVQQIQSKITLRFDFIRKSLITRLIGVLGETLKNIFSDLAQKRLVLESLDLNLTSTTLLVHAITVLQECREVSLHWRQQTAAAKEVEAIIQRQRFVLPDKWLSADKVLHELNYFLQIYARRKEQLERNTHAITTQVAQEEVALNAQLTRLYGDWSKNKPVDDITDYVSTISTLSSYEHQLATIKENLLQLCSAKTTLDMPHNSVVEETTRLCASLYDEVSVLREVWSTLSVHYKQIDSLGATLIKDCKPIDLRRSLNEIHDKVNTLPGHIRSYTAYDNTK